jgi:hypothetical protein
MKLEADVRINVHMHDPQVETLLREALSKLGLIIGNQETIMAALDDLTAQVASNRTVIQSALTLIAGIADRITAAGTDPAALAALTASLKSDDDALAAAVVANTPAAPPTL